MKTTIEAMEIIIKPSATQKTVDSFLKMLTGRYVFHDLINDENFQKIIFATTKYPAGTDVMALPLKKAMVVIENNDVNMQLNWNAIKEWIWANEIYNSAIAC